MDSITIGWNKYSSDEVQFLTNRQYFQQDSKEKLNNQDKNFNKKKVHFSSNVPSFKQQAFENTEQNHSKINRTPRLNFEDHNYISSSSTNIFNYQLLENDTEPICTKRGTVIIFIIIVLIILAEAIAVGIVFGTVKTSRSVTRNANQPSLSTVSSVSTTAVTSSVNIGSQNGAPCLSYTTINDPSRSVMQTGFLGSCDNGSLFYGNSDGAWIRFVGSGGTIMASSSPGIKHCGGYATGWFNGALPTTLGAIFNGSVCFTVDASECVLNYETSVIYCTGNFYVYFLQPVIFCNSRYCTA